MNILRSIFLMSSSGKIRATGPSLTLLRLCTSRHLQDLQQIASFAFIVYFFSAIIVLFFHEKLAESLLGFAGLTSTIAAILSWTYQTGSKRIGTIDLFANEIAVICRVCLIVDFARNSVLLPTSGPDGGNGRPTANHRNRELSRKFVSQEQYTPVYDRNVSDLQPFDVDVVTSVTRFYTYRKTMVDYLRMLAIYDGAPFEAAKKQMIYMQYLMYESAREAIMLLVEFEPNQAENLINILCSEVTLFSFLNQSYQDDFRGDRLRLRNDEYRAIMIDIRDRMKTNFTHRNWEKARVTYPELEKRYSKMCSELNISFVPDL